MSWGVDFKTSVFLLHESFNSLFELDTRIEEVKSSLESHTQQLLMYAISTPKDITTDQDVDLVTNIKASVNEVIKELEEDAVLLFKLNLYKDYLENNPESPLI